MRRVLQAGWFKYVVALAAVGVALALRFLLEPWLGRGGATLTLFGAIAVSVWYGGWRPGVLATLVGFAGAQVFVRGAPPILEAGSLARLAAFVFSAALIIALGGAMHAARRRAESDAQAARRHAEALQLEIEEHRRTRADLQSVTDTMSVAVARCSKDLRYLWVNRLYAEWAGNGRTAEQIIGRPMVEVLGAEAMEKMGPHLREILAGRRVEYERYARRARGRRWIRASLDPTFEADGQVSGWVAVIHDIDDSKRGSEQLREAREQLQVVTDNIAAAVCRFGNDLRFAWVNPAYARWVGRPRDRIVGQTIEEVIGAEQMREVAPRIARVLQGEAVDYEREANLAGLGKRWIQVVLTPIIDSAGLVDGWVAIAADIHDRKTNEQLLREADRRKDDFLATLAHELRNPLAPIRNAVAVLGRKDTADPEVAWSREVIGRQAEQMARLIDDLLDIERISRGKFLVRKERIPLEKAIDMALEMSRPYITAAGHRLSVLMPTDRTMVDADPARLAQVFSNLLNNAAKFTEPRGEIQLAAAVEGRHAVVTVEDNGIGFPPEVASRLFRPYSQLTGAKERSRGGLGIGLSLVEGIVTLHGGRVEARSEGPGRGAVFTVRLPLAGTRDPAEEAASPKGLAVPPPGMRVLVADDNRDAADSLERVLKVYGYEVRTAYDGAEALALAEEFQPHIAVLDIGMPRATGYEVAREMRRRHGASVTLVALTGWGQENDRRRALEAGFDYHLTKPVDPAALNDLLAETAGKISA